MITKQTTRKTMGGRPTKGRGGNSPSDVRR